MPAYTVHEPPLKAGEAAGQVDRQADRVVFVRDRFAVWAFLLTPLWLIVKRLWLVLLLYVLFTIAVWAVLHVTGVRPSIRFAVMLAVSLLVGLEASTLQRWTLARRKWKQVGVVVARNAEDAERRFFAQWVPRKEAATPPPAEVPSRFTPPAINQTAPHPIGFFPEPGARR